MEEKLNGRFSVVAVAPERGSLLHCYNYLHWKNLPNDVKDNPDKYILPLDIVYRPIDSNFNHYGIYSQTWDNPYCDNP